MYATHSSSFRAVHHQPARQAPARALRALPPDLMGIVGFATAAQPVLPLTPVTAPTVLSAPTLLIAGGNTNLTVALRLSHRWLTQLPRHIVRRVVIVGDGEPNLEIDTLMAAVSACRDDWISVDTIFCGGDGSGEQVLRSISGATIGGHHFAAASYAQLKDQVVAAAGRPHRRQGATVVAVDCSASMGSLMPDGGQTRIAAAIAACQAAALIRRTAFNRVEA